MSHYAKLAVMFDQKYEAQMVKALEEVFGKGSVEVHDNPISLKTWQNQDSTKQQDKTLKAEKCHVVIRKETLQAKGGGLCNDAGYRRNDEGKYDAFVDEAGFPKVKQNMAAQSYSSMVTELKLKAQGYTITKEVLPNGKVQITGKAYT